MQVIGSKFSIKFQHDVFRYIFKNKGFPSNLPGATMLVKYGFKKMMLPSSWHYTLNKEGHPIKFNVRANWPNWL